jgi:hypothetical protein
MLPTLGRLRVLVASDQVLLAESIQVALTSQGHDAVVLGWSSDAGTLPRQPPAESTLLEVGLLICELDRWSRVEEAASVVAGVGVPCLALTNAPRGPAWGALRAAGAELVLPVEIGLECIGELLESVGLHKSATPADERIELEAAWAQARYHHRTLERVIQPADASRPGAPARRPPAGMTPSAWPGWTSPGSERWLRTRR